MRACMIDPYICPAVNPARTTPAPADECLPGFPPSTSGINCSSANGDTHASTSMTAPASTAVALPSLTPPVRVDAARAMTATITNLLNTNAARISTRRLTHRLVTGHTIAANVNGKNRTHT